MENKNLQQRDGFSSKLGIIAAAAGSAIGLGNIWKFPYITGRYGGAAFILVYLFCIALIGLPVMLQEFTIGRRSQANAISSFKKLKPNTPWFLTGWLGFITAFVILSYYGVVAGWTLSYVFSAITNSFAGQDPEALKGMFGGLVTNPLKPIIFQVVFMALTAGVILGGVKNGIEKYSKILMPLLLAIVIILDIRAITLPGSGEGIAFLFQPDFSKLTASAVMSALGHAFFSLSLGMGTMITYGSYIGKKENLGVTALQVTIADTAIALLAGLAIFPAVFAFGIEPGAGTGLVFITLPNVFNQMPGGYIFAILFFLLLSVAALTSSISILEVVVAYFVEDKGWNRKKATIIATVAITALGAFESLTNGTINLVLPLLKGGVVNQFGFFDWMIEMSDLLLPIGGFFISIFVGWIMTKADLDDEITNGGELTHSWTGIFEFLTKFVAPLLILFTLLNLIFGWF
ncbi:sodium-dependent transporter [Fusibacter ferrireducens]|uniref:Transporter n=1 Tax=Fusibacter ferrireducens TaxID=2785058 RepID=A0ABR9ZZD2_9FIRM|nr:sodium-dependent transporter [Fusibacter ferrireducens]MBF4695804.1 sodium-dependent transporter [Fusibacter ferrireducens]